MNLHHSLSPSLGAAALASSFRLASAPTAVAAERRREAIASEQSTWFSNVLVGVDGTSTGRDAIALVDRLRAKAAQVTLAHVAATTTGLEEACGMLERERAAMGVSAEVIAILAPSVGSGLHVIADDRGADLLVVGTCARGSLGRLLWGNDTRGSLNGTNCPVAVAPQGYSERARDISTIGVAYNGTPESDAALAAARHLAERYGAALRALTAVWPSFYGAASGPRVVMMLDAIEAAACERFRSLGAVDGQVTIGPPGQELLAFGDEVDLLVVGSHGHGPLRRLVLGSTSAYLARVARCPLLILPKTASASRLSQDQ